MGEMMIAAAGILLACLVIVGAITAIFALLDKEDADE